MAATFTIESMQPHRERNNSGTLEGLRGLQKVSEEKAAWPDGVGSRPKAWKEPVGMGKGLWRSKAWEAEHGVLQRWGRP